MSPGFISKEELMFPLFVEQKSLKSLQFNLIALGLNSLKCNVSNEPCKCNFKTKLTGKGATSFCDGSKYIGELYNGIPHGQGTLEFENGDKYTGWWDNGIKHGIGSYEYARGSKYYGKWSND